MKPFFFSLIALLVAGCTSHRTALGDISLEGKRVLLVYGGWDGHQPKECMERLRPWLEEWGAKVMESESLDVYADNALMDSVDLVVQSWTMGNLTREQEAGLTAAVRNGMGLAGWHGGLCDAFHNNTTYQFMTGGQWVAHPGNTVDYDVDISSEKDFITSGLKRFHMKSEQYYMHVDPSVEVLATTTFGDCEEAPWVKGVVMPVVWKKRYGKGRVFYSSLCHSAADFDVPEAMTIMKRGILWAVGSRQAAAE